MEWQQFKTTPQYTSFLNAVRTMKANTNASSPSSWAYWTNVHVNYWLQEVTVSFVRVSSENTARGTVISMGEVRIEVSTEQP